MTENAYRKVTEDELEYERREARFKYQLQRNTELYVARSEGLEQGRNEGEAIGLKKGAAQKQREIAKSMLQEGIAKTVITKITGLSTEEIEKL